MQLIIGDTDGKSYKVDVQKDKEPFLMGKKIGDKVQGASLGMDGYVVLITGGSDKTGTPMRKGLVGTDRKYLLVSEGQGLRKPVKGKRTKVAVRGNNVSQEVVQVNAKVLQQGSKPLAELFPKQESENKDKKK